MAQLRRDAVAARRYARSMRVAERGVASRNHGGEWGNPTLRVAPWRSIGIGAVAAGACWVAIIFASLLWNPTGGRVPPILLAPRRAAPRRAALLVRSLLDRLAMRVVGRGARRLAPMVRACCGRRSRCSRRFSASARTTASTTRSPTTRGSGSDTSRSARSMISSQSQSPTWVRSTWRGSAAPRSAPCACRARRFPSATMKTACPPKSGPSTIVAKASSCGAIQRRICFSRAGGGRAFALAVAILFATPLFATPLFATPLSHLC